jgi:hypothetical protein
MARRLGQAVGCLILVLAAFGALVLIALVV